MIGEMWQHLIKGALGGLGRLWRDESATTTLECALLVAFVTLSAVAGYRMLGDTVSGGVSGGQEHLEGAHTTSVSGGHAGSENAMPPVPGAASPG